MNINQNHVIQNLQATQDDQDSLQIVENPDAPSTSKKSNNDDH